MERFKKLIKSIHDEVGNYTKVEFGENTYFQCTLRASFSKLIEFNNYLYEKKDDDFGFFLTPVLRGVCEDIIAHKFIKSELQNVANELTWLIAQLNILENIRSQDIFFTSKRNFQPVIRKSEYTQIQDLKNQIKSLLNDNGINGNRMPPIAQQAEKVGLKEIYDFLYRASSNFVHYNPHVLLRFGWNVDKSKLFDYSVKNFDKYYFYFTNQYSIYLMCLFCNEFNEDLNLSKELMNNINLVENELNEMLTWYELVTFEELNQKRPPECLVLYSKIISENEDKI